MSDHHDYTIGWVTATKLEWVAAQQFLRSRHEPKHGARIDGDNIYSLGNIGSHKIVIATASSSENEAPSMASVMSSMLLSFPNIRIGLQVGMSCGPLIAMHDIPLGDFVASSRHEQHEENPDYDLESISREPVFPNPQPLDEWLSLLRAAVSRVKTRYKENGHQLQEHVTAILESNLHLHKIFGQPPTVGDRLSQLSNVHQLSDYGYKDSRGHGPGHPVARAGRSEHDDNQNPSIRFEPIASANTEFGNAEVQDTLAAEKAVFRFEAKVVRHTNYLPYLKVSGFCDYADSYVTRDWQGYAAMVTAAYAKELLLQIQPSIVEEWPPMPIALSVLELETMRTLGLGFVGVLPWVLALEQRQLASQRYLERSSNNRDSDVSRHEPDDASQNESIPFLPPDHSFAITIFPDSLSIAFSGLVDFLCDDPDLQLVNLLKKNKGKINIQRFSREFGRRLRRYGRNLRREASNPLQFKVATFIKTSASQVAKRIGADLLPEAPDQQASQDPDPMKRDEEVLNKWIESQRTSKHSRKRRGTYTAYQKISSRAVSDSDGLKRPLLPMANSLEAAKVFLCTSRAHVKLRRNLRRWLKKDDDEPSDPEEQSVPETWTPANIYSPYSIITLPMFVNSLLDIWGVSLHPPAPEQITRVTWRCECGTWLSDGVVEMKPQAAEALQLALHHGDNATETSRLPNKTSKRLQSFMHSLSNTVTLTIQLLRNLIPGKAQPSGQQASQLPTCATAAVSAQGKQIIKDSIRLLLCIDKGRRTTLLYQEPLLNITTDRQVFDLLRLKYYEHRGLTSWFTLRGVNSVALTKFTIDASCFAAISRHNLTCVQRTCECIPPLTRVVDSKEYSCSPSPERPPSTIPALTPCRLTHYFLKPHAALCDRQSAILRQLPKRVGGGELQALPEGFEDGWGLHFQEDWHWPSVLFVCVVFVVGALVFGVTWTVVKKDIQSACAVSAVVIAIPLVLLALMAIRDSA